VRSALPAGSGNPGPRPPARSRHRRPDRRRRGSHSSRPSRRRTDRQRARRRRLAGRGRGRGRRHRPDPGRRRRPRNESREDARLAVERHATSKLAPDGDPVGVGSLGFRGEALAAIAEAARLELVTSDGDPVGTRVVVGGRRATSIRTVPPSPTPDAPAAPPSSSSICSRPDPRVGSRWRGRRPSSRGLLAGR